MADTASYAGAMKTSYPPSPAQKAARKQAVRRKNKRAAKKRYLEKKATGL